MLRAVNVGGRSVSMKALQQLFVDLGHTDAVTYIQSGNVVFSGSAGDPEALAQAIKERIAEDLGVAAGVLLRTEPALAEVARSNPFLAAGADPKFLHVTFLATEVAPERVGGLDGAAFEPDEFSVVGREVYLHCPGGYGRTKLNNAFWERRLGVAATTRNWRTVTTLLDLPGRL
jgi:uncharacterized protein (DUF1697 family)